MATDGSKSEYVLTEGRRRNMQAIRRRDTRRELAIRRALHALGYRYRVDHRMLAGDRWVRPDIVFPRKRLAVFLDGCAFHGCPEHGMRPRVNTDYWGPKLERNMQRDRQADAALTSAGWSVVRMFEHEPVETVLSMIIAAAGPPRHVPGSGSA